MSEFILSILSLYLHIERNCCFVNASLGVIDKQDSSKVVLRKREKNSIGASLRRGTIEFGSKNWLALLLLTFSLAR